MKTKKHIPLNTIDNEQGFVLVLSMVMLVILSLMGSFALNNTRMELQISGNERAAQDMFYVAESGWMRGFQWIENWGTSSAPRSLNGVDADSTLPLVAQVSDQALGDGTYSYTIRRRKAVGKESMVPGNGKGSGSDKTGYRKYFYIITSTATGSGNASQSITVGVEKIAK